MPVELFSSYKETNIHTISNVHTGKHLFWKKGPYAKRMRTSCSGPMQSHSQNN